MSTLHPPFRPMTKTHRQTYLSVMLIVKKALEQGFARISVTQRSGEDNDVYIRGWQINLYPNTEQDTDPFDHVNTAWLEIDTTGYIHSLHDNLEPTLQGVLAWIESQQPIHPASHHLHDIALFRSIEHGWSVSRTVRYEDPKWNIPDYHSYSFHAINHFYNIEGHDQHRDNGTDVSQEWWLGFMPDKPNTRLFVNTNSGVSAMKAGSDVTQQELVHAITHNPPWYNGTQDPPVYHD